MKKIILPLFLVLLSLSQCAKKDAPPLRSALLTPDWYQTPITDTLTILSWNTEHFVDDHDDPYIDNDRENSPPENMPERRSQLAEVLKRADADIVVFQEFESSSYAQKLAEEYFPELGYQVFGGMESDDWYMNVVVMSRVPLGTFYSYGVSHTPIPGELTESGYPAGQRFLNNRMWSVDVLVNDSYDLNLTGVHMKAGRGDRNMNWRIGMFGLLRQQLQQFTALDPERNLLVVGDFNSTPDSPEFEFFLGKDTDLVFTDPLAGTGVFSHPADSAFWRIDHIIPNTSMAEEIVPGSVQMFTPFSPDSMAFIADHLPMLVKIVPMEK
jgi:endonuclease/exonuclease/phosphatase family metal-dependent hydrolase